MNKQVMVAAAAAVLLAGCSSGEVSTDRCQPVHDDLLAAILAESVTPLEPIEGVAVKSADFEGLYMVAIRFTGAGLEEDPPIGVWATQRLEVAPSGDPVGVTVGVDGAAHQFTTWQHGDKRGVSRSDDGVAEAKACLTSI